MGTYLVALSFYYQKIPMRNFLIVFAFLFIVGCQSPTTEEQKNLAQYAVDQSIAFHQLEGIENASYSFDFRDMHYTYEKNQGRFTYTRTQTDSLGQKVVDKLTNEGLTRTIDGELANITEEKRIAYTESVNSVIYFFHLPYGLNDAAVIKQYNGLVTIKNKQYHEVEITFQQEGGGTDYTDVFLYWFDETDFSMDYMGYLYHTDGGGMRFREAINQRRVNDALIQDYINLKPEDEDIDIHELDDLYNAGKLIELSRIINENVKITWHSDTQNLN